MSQFILDAQVNIAQLLPRLSRLGSVKTLQELRPGEVILDDRVPEILRTLTNPTFLTIDHGFWDRSYGHPEYCILYFALRDDQQAHLLPMLRALLKEEGFVSRKDRMGKVAKVGRAQFEFYEFSKPQPCRRAWPAQIRKTWKEG